MYQKMLGMSQHILGYFYLLHFCFTSTSQGCQTESCEILRASQGCRSTSQDIPRTSEDFHRAPDEFPGHSYAFYKTSYDFPGHAYDMPKILLGIPQISQAFPRNLYELLRDSCEFLCSWIQVTGEAVRRLMNTLKVDGLTGALTRQL